VWRVKKMFENFPAHVMSGAYPLCTTDMGVISGAYHICAMHILVGPIGPRWGPHIINGAYFLICATNRENIRGAYNKCATDKT
jgi:hypothetical protein